MYIKFVKIKIVYNWFNNLIFKNIEYLLQYFTNPRIDDWNFDTFQISITLYVYNGNFKISSIFDNLESTLRVLWKSFSGDSRLFNNFENFSDNPEDPD